MWSSGKVQNFRWNSSSQKNFFTEVKNGNETATKLSFPSSSYLSAEQVLPFTAQLFTQGISAKFEMT